MHYKVKLKRNIYRNITTPSPYNALDTYTQVQGQEPKIGQQMVRWELWWSIVLLVYRSDQSPTIASPSALALSSFYRHNSFFYVYRWRNNSANLKENFFFQLLEKITEKSSRWTYCTSILLIATWGKSFKLFKWGGMVDGLPGWSLYILINASVADPHSDL